MLALLASCAAPETTSPTAPHEASELARELTFTLRELWRRDERYVGDATLTALGDENRDGVRELAVCTDNRYFEFNATGLVRVFDGASGGSQRAHAGLERARLATVACVSDVDGDGLEDFAVSGSVFAHFDDPVWGGVRLLRGGTSEELAARPKFSFGRGLELVTLGDVDGDGRRDLGLIQRNDFEHRELVLLSGATLAMIAWPNQTQPLSLAFMCTTAAGDVDGDGHDEFTLVDTDWQLHMISGKSLRPIWSTSVSDSDGWSFLGPITLGPDLDRDGARDLLATAWFPSMPNPGLHRLEMISARTGARTTLTTLDGTAESLVSLAVLEDLDRDGVSDLALGIVGPSRSRIELLSLGCGSSLARFDVPCVERLCNLATSADHCVFAVLGAIDDSDGLSVVVHELISSEHVAQ